MFKLLMNKAIDYVNRNTVERQMDVPNAPHTLCTSPNCLNLKVITDLTTMMH